MDVLPLTGLTIPDDTDDLGDGYSHLRAIGEYLEAAAADWVAYAPALTAPTAPTGWTGVGRRRVHEGTMDFVAQISIGAGFAPGAGAYSITLPFAVAGGLSWSLPLRIWDGTGLRAGTLEIPAGASAGQVWAYGAAPTRMLQVSGASVPWAVGQNILVGGRVEV